MHITQEVPQVVRVGHAMCDDGALQRHHRLVVCQRLCYQRMNSEQGLWEERSRLISLCDCDQT